MTDHSAREKMRTIVAAILLLGISAPTVLAQEAPNAARKVEISYLFLGSIRKGGTYKAGACADVAVAVTEPLAVVGATCATHQDIGGVEVEDSLGSFHGGLRYRKPLGRRFATFVESLVGAETGFRHGGFRGNTGFSLNGGGGIDWAIKNWLALRMIYVKYQTTWIDGMNVDGLRVHSGLVFRIGKR